MPSDGPSYEGPDQDADARDLAETEQSLADADQTSADLDQTSSDSDQTASDSDQRASARDQEASDLDQAASDQTQGDGPETAIHAHTRREREQSTLVRGYGTASRSQVAMIRDETAARRDRVADDRDAAAAARDRFAAALDAELERQEADAHANGQRAPQGMDLVLAAAADRKRAAESRARAAAQRAAAARDRQMAQQDRRRAAADREAAARDLAAEGIDPLTGTLLRRVGYVALQRELDRSDRTHAQLVFAFVDIDGLKAINDRNGHDAGDAVIHAVAECIREALRPYDVVMRFGGDEFVVSLSGQPLARVRERFDDIAVALAAKKDGAAISVGFAERVSGESIDELIVCADRAMIVTRENQAR